MAADADVEIENTLARLATLVGGRVFESAAPDDEQLPRNADGSIKPYIVADFGAPVRSTRDRNITNPEKGQPHVLPLTLACIAGDASSARKTAKAVIDLLLDWQPAAPSDTWELKGGFGSHSPSTSNTPTRFIRGLFLEVVINLNTDWDPV